MKKFNYKGNKFEIGLQTICDEEFIVTKGYELEEGVYSKGELKLYIGTKYEQGGTDITINNKLLAQHKLNYEQNGRTYEKLIKHLEKICNEKEEREFKCDDFHIKLWQTKDKIGGETVFVKEGFSYGKYCLNIEITNSTELYKEFLPCFGMEGTTDSILKPDSKYTFSDIAEALQEAVEYSKNKEVTFDTFYNECKGKSPEEIVEICKGYEAMNWNWHSWVEVDCFELQNKELYIFNLRQIRRKK